jgi:hypothetical protein
MAIQGAPTGLFGAPLAEVGSKRGRDDYELDYDDGYLLSDFLRDTQRPKTLADGNDDDLGEDIFGLRSVEDEAYDVTNSLLRYTPPPDDSLLFFDRLADQAFLSLQ